MVDFPLRKLKYFFIIIVDNTCPSKIYKNMSQLRRNKRFGTLAELEIMPMPKIKPISQSKPKEYFRQCIRDGQLLEQMIGDSRVVFRYDHGKSGFKDQFTITYPKNLADKTYYALDSITRFHSKHVGLAKQPNPWKITKIVCWNFLNPPYPSDSIENLPALPDHILQKQIQRREVAKLKLAAEEAMKTATLLAKASKNSSLYKLFHHNKTEHCKSGGAASFLSLRKLHFYSYSSAINSCPGIIHTYGCGTPIKLCSYSGTRIDG